MISVSSPHYVVARNSATSENLPRLSVLVPTFRYDPSALIAALTPAADKLKGAVELIIYDDGSRDPRLVCAIMDALHAFAAPAALIVAESNAGRAIARNTLLNAARARHALFLDADMAPVRDDFLDVWLSEADQDVAVACGGFTVPAAAGRAEALHRNLALRSDCRSATQRARRPAHAVVTSNLLVRRDVLVAHPFDEQFAGWGWEDVDWALRVHAHHEVRHIDNPALHHGLDSVETLLRKYAQSGANFARLALRHRDAMPALASWRIAHLLQHTPAHRKVRPMLARIARADSLPLALRRYAIKLFRASVHAEAIA